MIRHRCPHCRRVESWPDHLAGSVTTCPRCRQALEIPPQFRETTQPDVHLPAGDSATTDLPRQTDVARGEPATLACPHCGQVAITRKATFVRRVLCARCGQMSRVVPQSSTARITQLPAVRTDAMIRFHYRGAGLPACLEKRGRPEGPPI